MENAYLDPFLKYRLNDSYYPGGPSLLTFILFVFSSNNPLLLSVEQRSNDPPLLELQKVNYSILASLGNAFLP